MKEANDLERRAAPVFLQSQFLWAVWWAWLFALSGKGHAVFSEKTKKLKAAYLFRTHLERNCVWMQL